MDVKRSASTAPSPTHPLPQFLSQCFQRMWQIMEQLMIRLHAPLMTYFKIMNGEK